MFLTSPYQGQKKRIAEEEAACKKMGLGVRLLPASKEDSAVASKVKFTSKFERNRKDKRALINASSIFSEPSGSSLSNKRLELESKRRRINAAAASNILTRGLKSSSWSNGAAAPSKAKIIFIDA